VQSYVHGAVSATQMQVVGELPDVVQSRLNIQRIPADKVRLEHQRNAFDAGIADLAQTVHALVGVDADDRMVETGRDPARAHIGDLQIARRGIPIEAARLRNLSGSVPLDKGQCRSPSGRAAEQLAAADIASVRHSYFLPRSSSKRFFRYSAYSFFNSGSRGLP